MWGSGRPAERQAGRLARTTTTTTPTEQQATYSLNNERERKLGNRALIRSHIPASIRHERNFRKEKKKKQNRKQYKRVGEGKMCVLGERERENVVWRARVESNTMR